MRRIWVFGRATPATTVAALAACLVPRDVRPLAEDYSLLPEASVLIVPSRGVRQDWRVPVTADTVFLGTGGLAWSREQLRPVRNQYVVGSRATRVYPIHWDDFFAAPDLSRPPEIPKRLRRTFGYLRELEDRAGMVRIPYYAMEIVVGGGRPAQSGFPAATGPEGCRQAG